MQEKQAAAGLAALGNRSRLRLYKLLVKAGRPGLNVGTIQTRVRMPASTLAHHLATLARAGLVVQQRQGREVITSANFEAVEALADYLTSECCADLKADTDAA